MDNKIKSKWEFLLQCRPSLRSITGNAKLVGGYIGHNENDDEIFNFVTTKGTYSYDERTDEFKSKLQIR